VDSLTLLLEAGVPSELAPEGSFFKVTSQIETALSLPLEPSVALEPSTETQQAEDVSVGPSVVVYPSVRTSQEPLFRALSEQCSYRGETVRWLLVTEIYSEAWRSSRGSVGGPEKVAGKLRL